MQFLKWLDSHDAYNIWLFVSALSQMRIYIRRERRIDLSFEEGRWFDIRRWEITTGPTEELTNPEYGMKIVNNGGVLYYTPWQDIY